MGLGLWDLTLVFVGLAFLGLGLVGQIIHHSSFIINVTGTPGCQYLMLQGKKSPARSWLADWREGKRVDGFGLELMEESDVVVVEEPEVVDGVADHGESLDAQSEGEA